MKGIGNLEFQAKSIKETGLIINGEVRDIKLLSTPTAKLIFIAKSDARWQVLRIN
jgi:ribosomal protein L30E